ncbi:MAG: putative polysaccharide biosynthesis protein [Actinomycetia bacterium]|nr:putative polysaccharide biosynthesis protein [Actinomycetes bacterium]
MMQEQGVDDAQIGKIGRKAARGLRWSILGNIVTRAGSFIMSLVLARLLIPHDYGTFGIALAASQFLIHINDVGILSATVQWRGKLEEMAPTGTIMAFLFSLVVYAAFWTISPFYAELSGSSAATPVIRLLTLIIVIDGVTAVRAGALMRNFQQHKIILANLAGFAVQAPVTIILAANGAGAFSFAWGQVACNVVIAVLVLWFARMPFRFELDPAIIRYLLRFGMPLALSLGVEGLILNVDKVVVGDTLGVAMLGYYMVAFNMSSWIPGLIGTAVRYVSLPSFSRLAEQDASPSEDRELLSQGVQRSVSIMVAFVLPFAIVMATLSPALIVFLYGQQWAPSAAALQFLSAVMVVRMLIPLTADVLTSLGTTRYTVALNLTWFAALIPALIIGTRLGGIRGASLGQAIVGLLVAVPLGGLMLHRAGVRLRPIGPALVRPLLAGVLAATTMVALSHLTSGIPFVQLAVAGGAGFILFVLIVVPRAQLRALGGRLRPARAN